VRVIGRNKPTLQGRCIGILFDEVLMPGSLPA
jgi:hypothetical protein